MLPHPTIHSVQKECDDFDKDDFTKNSEQALSQLIAAFPQNTDVSQVLSKVIVLDQLYSTRIRYVDLLPFARHIVASNVDSPIEVGSPKAVELIWDCKETRQYYSFATKFCSWHNPAAYPIYDHYVDESLWAYKQQDSFYSFHRQDLYDYEKFVNIVTEFKLSYGLESFSVRDIDKFLWNVGYQLLSKNADAATDARATS